jgi:hypothetical protein
MIGRAAAIWVLLTTFRVQGPEVAAPKGADVGI